MDQNNFINFFNPANMQNYNQPVSPLPLQNLSLFPPTPPQQNHYQEELVHHINTTPLIEDINHSSYNIEASGFMTSGQSLFPYSLPIQQSNLLLTPSQSTESRSSNVINLPLDLSQDFSLYSSSFAQNNTNPVDHGCSLTIDDTHSVYSHSELGVYASPRSSCSPNIQYEHQFVTCDDKKKPASSKKKKHNCPICGKGFGRPQEVQRHQVCHTGAKNFSCEICLKKFARRDAMRRHFKAHFRDKPKNTTRTSKLFC